MQCLFLVPRDLPGPSGGTHYNTAVIAALRALGHSVRVLAVPGAWPHPRDEDRRALMAAMSGPHPVVVDGIVALAEAGAVQSAVESGARVHILVHSLLTADPSLSVDDRRQLASHERDALLAASSVSCASLWSASDVVRRHPGVHPHVLFPGTSPAPLSPGSTLPQLLALAALTPVKNHLHLLRALAGVAELPWTLHLVGSDAIAPEYAGMLHRFAEQHLPPGRVTFHGALTGDELARVWDATDLLILTSTSETFGMVVTEALARGIPAVVPAGTGAVEALLGHDASLIDPFAQRPGAIVDPSDAEHLGEVLVSWLSSPGCRERWRAAAISRRPRLQRWAETAAGLARILQE